MSGRRRLLQHLQGRPLLKRVLLSEVFGAPRSRNPHPTARPPAQRQPARPPTEDSTGE